MQKLPYYGIRRTELNWFENYLNNKKQYVVIGDKNSDFLNTLYGVLQGSVLRPVLFLGFVNDVHYFTKIIHKT